MLTSRRTKDGAPVMDIDYTTLVQTPHVPWAVPYCKGPLKAFFLPSVKYGRDYVELLQRLQLDATSVTHDRAWDLDKWGIGDYYDKRVRIWEYETVYSYMADVLDSDREFDVLVLHSVNGWAYWPKAARQAILRRVKEGAGLVIVRPFDGPARSPELAELSPLVNCPSDKMDDGGYPIIAVDRMRSAPWQPEGSHFITKNIPFEALPCEDMAYFPCKTRGDVIITAGAGDPLAAVREVGKGRVAAFAWYNRDLVPQHREHIKPTGGLSSNSDFWQGGFSSCTWNYLEYVYALLAKAVVWAADREPEVDFDAAFTAGERPYIEVTLKGAADDIYEVEAIISNQWGIEEMKFDKAIQGEEGGGSLQLPLPEQILAGGAHFADIIVKNGGEVANWGAVRFDLAVPARISSITTDKEVYRSGEKVVPEIAVEGEGVELRLEIALVDAFNRVVAGGYRDVEAGVPVKMALSREGVMSPQMWVRVRLTSGGRLLDQQKSPRLTAVPAYDRNIHDLEIVVAQYDRGRGDYVEAIRRQLMAFGATNGYYGYSKILAESGAEGGGIYWYHRAPYIERKEKYLRTKDKKHLARVPCLSDPAFLQKVHDRIVEISSKGTKYAPLSYYVQDEGSLTCYCDEFDLCFDKHTLSAMRQWLRREYRDIKKLNAEWGTKFSAWEKVVPMTLEEARAHGNYAPWADHRTFMEMAFAEYFRHVRDSVREVDADARIRLSGCQVSTSYTGMDYWRLHQIIEYFEAYGGGNQFEFHQSFAGPRTIIGTWIGYGQKGRASNNSLWHAFFHQIRLMSVFWEFAVINPDFTLSGSAEDMASTLRQIRGSGVSRMLFDAERDDSKVAIHYSYPSIHATLATGRFDRHTRSREGWLAVLQDLGYQQRFISRQQIEAGDLISRRFKVLILPLSMAIAPREAAEIRKFVKAGGRVIADFQTGVMDEHCRRLDKGALDDVFGIERLDMRNERFFINGEPRRTEEMRKLDVGAVEDAGVIQEEPGVRAKGGKALLLDDFSHHVPSLVVNSYGKGKAVYLNFGADVAATDPDSPKAAAVTAAVGEALDFLGVKPIMKAVDTGGKPLRHVEMFHYRVPGVDYYALLRANVGAGSVLGYDGIVRAGDEGNARGEAVSLTLPTEGHLYDCLAKRHLGYGNCVETEIEPAEAKVFAVFPYEIRDLKIFIEAAGNQVDYDVEVLPSEGKAREHTIVMEVISPAGETQPLYGRNIAARGGKGRGSLLFSLEGESGAWTLRFTEAASGISKSVEVVVP